MITEKKAANALGGNTTRACDSCLVKRARWFCAADDAFLCRKCDASVHSANQLASRHERVRLQSSSFKANESVSAAEQSPPAWHKGFTRKARTPRHNKKPGSMAKSDQEKVSLNPLLPFVPEIGCEEANFMDDDDENEDLEQLLYRVPIYDPFAAELCNISSDGQVGNSAGANNLDDEVTEIRMGNHHEVGDENNNNEGGHDGHDDFDNLQGFLPSDMELAEFAADVENLLGGGLDEDSSEMTGVLGLLDDSKLEEEDGGHVDVCMNIHEINEDKSKSVKVEEELVEGMQFNPSMLDWNLEYDHHESSSPVVYSGEEEKVVFFMGARSADDEVAFMENKQTMKRKMCLRLNYEAVIAAWASQGGSPWTTGARPEINPDDGWPDCMSMWPSEIHQAHGCVGGRGDDRGREARVSRYREKRRNRLFSKKIRYEVRKLNAEKRPRMKGRFVKRTSSSNFVGSSSNAAAAAFPYLVNNK